MNLMFQNSSNKVIRHARIKDGIVFCCQQVDIVIVVHADENKKNSKKNVTPE